MRSRRERQRDSVKAIRLLLREAGKYHERTFNEKPYAVGHFDAWLQTNYERINDIIQPWTKGWLDNIEAVHSVKGNAVQIARVKKFTILHNVVAS